MQLNCYIFVWWERCNYNNNCHFSHYMYDFVASFTVYCDKKSSFDLTGTVSRGNTQMHTACTLTLSISEQHISTLLINSSDCQTPVFDSLTRACQAFQATACQWRLLLFTGERLGSYANSNGQQGLLAFTHNLPVEQLTFKNWWILYCLACEKNSANSRSVSITKKII